MKAELKAPLTPCPACHGTTNWDTSLQVLFCESCGREWNIYGRPVSTKKRCLEILNVFKENR